MQKKRRKIRRITAVFLAVCLAMPVFTHSEPVKAANDVSIGEGTQYETLAQIKQCIADADDGTTFKLNGDLDLRDVNDRIEFNNGKSYFLDLNGYTITGGGTTNSVILVGNNTALTLTDSGKGKDNATTSVRYNIVDENGTSKEHTYVGGGITIPEGNTINHLIYVKEGATFNMEGGALYGGNTDGTGAAIEALDSTVNLYSGVIVNNKATKYGGGICLVGSDLTIGKAKDKDPVIISGNTATSRGGGIYAYNGEEIYAEESIMDSSGTVELAGPNGRKGNPAYESTITINNDSECYITDNHVYKDGGKHLDNGGGGIRIDDDGVIVVNGGYITGNTSGSGGGGLMAGYYNTTGWTDTDGYPYIAEVDRVSVTINGGSISANESEREGAGVFIGGNCSGNVTGLYDTYIKNNKVAADTADWGGAGLFVGSASLGAEGGLKSLGLEDYVGPGSLHIQKAVIKNNTAMGFGGGVAGCATARVFINVDQIATEKDVKDGIAKEVGDVLNSAETASEGVAIYDNEALAKHDASYFPEIDEATGTDHLSGTSSSKNEDRTYTNGNRVFWDSGFQDYFCALNTQIGNNMLGGGKENWIGSADSVHVERGDNYTADDQNIYASYLTGLSEKATSADIKVAEKLATVEISGNVSGTHGGGILANGVLVLGDVPSGDLEVQDRIVINATKLVESITGETITHPATGFSFDVFQYDGLRTAVMNSVTDTDNDSSLGKMNMTFAYNGESSREPWAEYTYFIAERGNADAEYSADRDIYYISIMGTRTKEAAGDAFNTINEVGEVVDTKLMDIATITRVRILKKTLSPGDISYDENGTPTLLLPLAVGENTVLSQGMTEEEKTAKNDELWREWQKSYDAFVDANGEFVATYHGDDRDNVYTEAGYQVKTLENADITVVVDYELDKNGDVIKAEFANAEVGTDSLPVEKVIDLKTGTDHAKTLNLDLALGEETFVNVENKTSVTVEKVWNNISANATEKPAVTFELYQSTKEVNDATVTAPFKTITLDGVIDDVEATAWVAEFKDLPNTDTYGYEYKYWVKEANSAEGSMPYKPIYEGTKSYALSNETITNNFVQEYVTVNVTKKWDDSDNQDSMRPNSITVILYRDEKEVASKEVVESNGTWTCAFNNLEKYNSSGKAYTYTVGEKSVADYSTSIKEEAGSDNTVNYTITNSYAADETSVTVSKVWNDGNSANRPSVDITLHAVAGGQEITALSKNISLSSSNNWTYTFTKLPVNYNGAPIKYSVSEEPVDGYIGGEPEERGSNNFVIVNTKETSVTVTKKWVGADGKEEAIPDGAKVTFTLYADGVEKAAIILDGTVDDTGESEKWTATFSKLPKYRADGKEIVYTVKETEGHDGYINSTAGSFVSNGGVITNTQISTSVTVRKAWKNANGSTEAPKGASVTFTVYDQANPDKAIKSIILNGAANLEGEGTPWTATFTGLPMYAKDGKTEIKYIVKETAGRADYTTSYDNGLDYTVANGTITNTQKTVEVTVGKAWKDAEGKSISAPEGATATFTLYEGNSETAMQVVLDGIRDDNGETAPWVATFKNLPEYQADGKNALYYAVQETGTWEGYAPDKNFAENGETITNERVVVNKTTYDEITINKVNKDNEPLSGAEFTLYDDKGNVIGKYVSDSDGKVIISTKDDAVGTILPAAGASNKLTLKETKAPEGYKVNDSTWVVDIATTVSTDESLKANAVRTTAYEISVDGGDTLTVVNEKKPTTETTTESSTEQSTEPTTESSTEPTTEPTTDSSTETTTKPMPDQKETTDLTVTIKWDDVDNVDKTRPDKDTFEDYVYLTKDDEKVEDSVPDIKDNGDGTYTVTFEGLPKYDGDREIIYSLEQSDINKYKTTIEKDRTGHLIITNVYRPSTSTPEKPPVQTSDNSNVTRYIWLGCVALIVVMAVTLYRKSHRAY